MSKYIENAISALDQREIDLANRLEAVEGKVRSDQAQTIREAGLPADLISTEQNVWKRLSPTRNRWPEVAAFDERVAVHKAERKRWAARVRAGGVSCWRCGKPIPAPRVSRRGIRSASAATGRLCPGC